MPEAAPLDPDLTAARVRRDGKAKQERKWSAKFLAMFTAVGVSLASYGVPEADWLRYQQDVVAVGRSPFGQNVGHGFPQVGAGPVGVP